MTEEKKETLIEETQFELKNIELPQDYKEQISKVVTTRIPIRKPNKQWYFRAHRDNYVECMILEVDDRNETYFVVGHLIPQLQDECKHVKLHQCITKNGTLFFWPVPIQDPNGRINSWNQSARDAVEVSMETWIRMVSNQESQSYLRHEALAAWDEPDWPEMDLEQIMEKVTHDRLIKSLDHPILKELRGED